MSERDVVGLTPEDRHVVEQVVARVRKSRRRWTIEEIIAQWSRFTAKVETGDDERSTVDDYTHWLSYRDIIQEVLDAAPYPLGAKLVVIVEPIDRRFAQATRPDPDDILSQFYDHGNGWWWRRLPVRVRGQLAVDLSS
jgi:hypothetical protein